MADKTEKNSLPETTEEKGNEKPASGGKKTPKEFGGREGPEPTRYGDWENGGIISDF
ncbi:MAG: DUF1674 domain-containing protein [Kordiimonadaceae bacterium]|nr:DUF1674 domain-containing protein [Kordiimonadaceae bacterium]